MKFYDENTIPECPGQISIFDLLKGDKNEQ